MKTLYKTLLLLAFVFGSLVGYAQDHDKAKALIKEGITLHDEGKYDDAIKKYKEALALDPDNSSAQYELSFTFVTINRQKEAIPFLEKLAARHDSGEAYDLLASIYDDEKDYEKAVAYYKQGIIAFPDFQNLHFNLAISYLRQGKYADAEASAINAIKLNPKHASSQRAFALAANKQNKLGASLLAWCNFLLIEPQTQRSAEAMAYIKAIINNGIKRTGDKTVNITYNPDDKNPGNLMLPLSVMAATTDKKGLSALDSLTLQLTSLFSVAHTITNDKDQPFVASYYSDFFASLAKSGNMAAFTRYISLSVYKDENVAWFKEHDKELTAFDTWMQATKREF